MDLEDQWAIENAIQHYGKDELLVILGCPDAECAEMYAETVIAGDPSFAGPLAGVQLGLPVYHIIEPEIKALIPEDVYLSQIRAKEQLLDIEAICQRMKEVRAKRLPRK